MYIETVPSKPSLKMHRKEYRVALRYRYQLRVEGLIPGRRCGCGHHNILDIYGQHLAHGCNWLNGNNIIHDGLKLTLKRILQHAGEWVTLEERNLFPGTAKRTDVTIYNHQ